MYMYIGPLLRGKPFQATQMPNSSWSLLIENGIDPVAVLVRIEKRQGHLSRTTVATTKRSGSVEVFTSNLTSGERRGAALELKCGKLIGQGRRKTRRFERKHKGREVGSTTFYTVLGQSRPKLEGS